MTATRAIARRAGKAISTPKTTLSKMNKGIIGGKKRAFSMVPSLASPKCGKVESNTHILLDIKPPHDELVVGTVSARPSKKNKSPYVGDVLLKDGRTALVHMPSMDMGGKCVIGAQVLLKPARDPKGNLIGPETLGKYGLPKCEFIMQLLWVSEAENAPGCWVGAHPGLGEKIAAALLSGGYVSGVSPCPISTTLLSLNYCDLTELPSISSVQREVRNPAGCDMRADFVLSHDADGKKKTVVEIKTVVDTDYDYAVSAAHEETMEEKTQEKTPTTKAKKKKPQKKKCLYFSQLKPYVRSAIFPWGGGNQRGPEGEKVVSSRAIKHVRELTEIALKKKTEEGTELRSAVIFIVIREDAMLFRPNHEACPSFARYLSEARESGVDILAQKVRWGQGNDLGKAFWEGSVAVQLDHA